MTEDDLALKNFLASYFNQDWSLDAENPQEIVAQFLSDHQEPDELRAIVRAIAALLDLGLSEDELARRVLYDYGGYFDPRGLGQSNDTWLRAVSAQIERRVSGRS